MYAAAVLAILAIVFASLSLAASYAELHPVSRATQRAGSAPHDRVHSGPVGARVFDADGSVSTTFRTDGGVVFVRARLVPDAAPVRFRA